MRYEHAGKFWTITRVGSVVTTISGKIGNKGRTVVKHHPNDSAAISAHDQLVLEKQHEGYRIAKTDEPVKAPEIAPIDDDRGPALEAAIAANPDDAQAFAVYGDWLQKHGDPRGELIALQNATGPKAAAAAGKHLAQHAQRLLGPLASLVRDVRELNAAPFFWKHGFIRRAEFVSAKDRRVDAMVTDLFAHPSAKFLLELAVRAYDRKEALSVLDLARQAPPTLREFDLFARANLDRIDGAAWRTLPDLQRLTITARAYELTNLHIPTLVRGAFVATAIASDTVSTIATAPWPVLERLDIRFSGQRGHSEADFQDLRPLLVRNDMPALTHLRLRGCAFAGAVVRTLAAAPLARQLQLLDLSAGAFSPPDFQALATHAANFPNLRELWLPYGYVTPSLEKLLAPVAKRVLSDAKRPVDTIDFDLAGEAPPRGEERYGGIRE